MCWREQKKMHNRWKTEQNLTIKKSLNIPNIIFLVTLITMFGEARFPFYKLYSSSLRTLCNGFTSLRLKCFFLMNRSGTGVGCGIRWTCIFRVSWSNTTDYIRSCYPWCISYVVLFVFVLYSLPIYGWQNSNWNFISRWPLANTQWHSAGRLTCYHMFSFVAVVVSSSPKSFVLFFVEKKLFKRTFH